MIFDIKECVSCKSKLYVAGDDYFYCNNYYCYNTTIVYESFIEISFNKKTFYYDKEKSEFYYKINDNENKIKGIAFSSYEEFFKACNSVLKLEIFQ